MHIFYCVDGKYGEVTRVSLTKKHSLDALTVGIRRCACASGVLSVSGEVNSEHWTFGTGHGPDTVRASGEG